MNRNSSYLNRDCEFLRKMSYKHSEPELIEVADRIQQMEKYLRNLFLDLKPHMTLTEEQRFDRYGSFDIVE